VRAATLRIAIVALAAAAIVLLGTRLREHDRCQSAQTAKPLPFGELTANCRDPDVLAGASVVLLNAGRRSDAVRMARAAVRREPDSFAGWVAVAFVTRDRDPAQARRAAARAKALNPRWPGLPPAAAQGP
jgi:hypothetical protein